MDVGQITREVIEHDMIKLLLDRGDLNIELTELEGRLGSMLGAGFGKHGRTEINAQTGRRFKPGEQFPGAAATFQHVAAGGNMVPVLPE